MDLINFALASITFLNTKEKILLRNNLDSLDRLAVLSIEDISKIVQRDMHRVVWNGPETVKTAQKTSIILEKFGISPILYGEADFPALLHEINDPPYMIFCRGNKEVLYNKSVSVVGTRHLTRNGMNCTFDFARDAAEDGCTVISGLAFGVDSQAHKGALSSKTAGYRNTAAVLPCGIDQVSPHANAGLARRILEEGGCLVSEYVPGCPAEKWRYIQRNRIIAGLSPATVVMEAPPGSGALITADFAIDYNRDVFLHSACFSDGAKAVAKQTMMGISDGKAQHNTEKYLNDGAPVINNYADYLAARTEAPGVRNSKKNIQLNLFD